ncbi:hypothetical protein SETIT_4G199900v2 [Setaria italica]|uniref:Strictosidine synthase conserved region domain-containing protein n=1 Tax=Setaria italica TaxID=4555 RepID=A0A368QW64_SETIT|nr:hypothetical protein SETIT_4G199900v2 [Setaria italica]
MIRRTSKLPLLATLLAVLLLLPPSASRSTATAAGPTSASRTAAEVRRRRLEDVLLQPELHQQRLRRAVVRAPAGRQGEFNSCGRPLGLRFHRDSGDLYIADAYMGLMRVRPSGGEATVLATGAAGGPFRFTNGVDVDQVTGDIYFTDSSKTYQRSQHQMVTASGDSTGRIMKYDPRTKQGTVLQSGVTYPNGIAISDDRTHLIVALTGPCKLLRYWIQGPKAGTSEIFADLPGYPDNVRPDKNGGYWIALHREKDEFPFGVNKHLVAIRIGAQGEKLQEMTGPKNVRPTEVVERDNGKIYLGSVVR